MSAEERIIEIAKSVNDSAFPTPLTDSTMAVIKGLTKKEYFAGQAMQAIIAMGTGINPIIMADMAVGLAEALTERLKYKSLDEWTACIRGEEGSEFHPPLGRDIASGP